jgi:probable HAF family extracellular repeat protein
MPNENPQRVAVVAPYSISNEAEARRLRVRAARGILGRRSRIGDQSRSACVLFEDLRREYIGSRATEDLPLDALSKQYRKFYFLRRSLVSLDEFCGALNRLTEVKAWKKYVESHDDKRRRKMWADAVKFFNAKKERIETIRGDIGGHFPESAAKWSVERLHEDTTDALQIDYGDKPADAKLPFTELVAGSILRTAREQELPDDEMKAFISGIFDDVTDGWQHAGQVVGYSYTAAGSIHAFLWEARTGMQDLGTLGGAISVAYGINARGQIVGQAHTAAGETHAVLWETGSE